MSNTIPDGKTFDEFMMDSSDDDTEVSRGHNVISFNDYMMLTTSEDDEPHSPAIGGRSAFDEYMLLTSEDEEVSPKRQRTKMSFNEYMLLSSSDEEDETPSMHGDHTDHDCNNAHQSSGGSNENFEEPYCSHNEDEDDGAETPVESGSEEVEDEEENFEPNSGADAEDATAARFR